LEGRGELSDGFDEEGEGLVDGEGEFGLRRGREEEGFSLRDASKKEQGEKRGNAQRLPRWTSSGDREREGWSSGRGRG